MCELRYEFYHMIGRLVSHEIALRLRQITARFALIQYITKLRV